MIENYVTGNKLSRAGVSIDVKNRKLLAEDIKKLLHEIDRAVADGKLENPYIGKVYAEKLGKESWNERHLDKLVAVASSSECFNEDYLLYLAEVTKYVKSGGKRTMKKIKAIAITILVCLLAGFIGGFVASYKIPDRYMPGALAKNKNSVAKEDYDKLQKAYDKLDKENAQLKGDKEKMVSSDEYEKLKKEKDEIEQKQEETKAKLAENIFDDRIVNFLYDLNQASSYRKIHESWKLQKLDNDPEYRHVTEELERRLATEKTYGKENPRVFNAYVQEVNRLLSSKVEH